MINTIKLIKEQTLGGEEEICWLAGRSWRKRVGDGHYSLYTSINFSIIHKNLKKLRCLSSEFRIKNKKKNAGHSGACPIIILYLCKRTQKVKVSITDSPTFWVLW